MADVATILTEQVNTTNEIKSRVNLNGEAFKTFKFNTETVTPRVQATIISTRSIGGDILIWGNESFGTWNEFKWGNVAQGSFVLGNPDSGVLGIIPLGSNISNFIVSRIVPPNNVFDEDFVTTYFISTSDTTATISGGIVTF